MAGGFSIVPLSEVLRPVSRPESADPGITYHILGAHWYAKGLYIKHIKRGSEIQADKVYRVEHGDFVYNRLFAWKGSFAIATEENHGCYVSNEFPVFTINRDRAEGKYLWRYFSRASAWDEALSLSSGGTPTSRNRLKEEKLLAMKIPLPSLDEQRRIVARIEGLAAKIEEARDLRRQTANEVEALLSSGLRHLLMLRDGWQLKLISDCSIMSTGTTPPTHMEDYYKGNLQWYTPGDLKFSKTLGRSSRTVSDRAVAEGKARVFQPGTVLLVAIGASLGKVGLAYDRCSSNQQITGVKFSSDILPEYGFWWMRRLYSDLRAAAPQATLPIINQKRIGQFEIAIPPLREQRRIVAHLDDLQTKLVSTCINNRYRIWSWVKGGSCAQDSPHPTVFRS